MCVGTYVFMYVCVRMSIFEYIQRNVDVPDAETLGHTHILSMRGGVQQT